jgi:hypothetical protein
MKKYTKPVMDVIELERIDVLTCSVCEGDVNFSHNFDYWDSSTGKYSDGCKEGCTAHPDESQ